MCWYAPCSGGAALKGRHGMARARTIGIAAVMVAALDCGGTATEPAPGTVPSSEAAPAPPPTLGERVEVDEVAVLQATTATLLENATAPRKMNAPVIAQRPGLVRIHARQRDATARVPALTAELRVRAAGKPDIVMSDGPKALVTIDPSDLETTFDFELGADAFAPDSAITVTLRDPKAPELPPAVFPEDGTTLPLGARDSAPLLRVKLVPIRYDSDGSQRVPTLDSAAQAEYERALMKMYPLAKVETTVREPLAFAAAIEARGKGWDDVLDAVINARRADRVPDDVYYVGVFNPKETIDEYCTGACILGVAPAAMPEEIGLRVATIVGYEPRFMGGTIAQELAHAMGREHAPCGDPDGPDPEFPYSSGGIGVPGWDIFAKKLVDPSGRSKDFMSYCEPVWVSDYTFAGLFERMAAVAKTKRPETTTGTGSGTGTGTGRPSTTELVRSFHVGADGSMRLGPLVERLPRVGGEPPRASVRYEDATGHTLASHEAAFRNVGGTRGGLLLAPEPPVGAARLRVSGLAVGARTLDLRAAAR